MAKPRQALSYPDSRFRGTMRAACEESIGNPPLKNREPGLSKAQNCPRARRVDQGSTSRLPSRPTSITPWLPAEPSLLLLAPCRCTGILAQVRCPSMGANEYPRRAWIFPTQELWPRSRSQPLPLQICGAFLRPANTQLSHGLRSCKLRIPLRDRPL